MWGTEWPKLNIVVQGKYFLWTMTSNSLTENEEHGIPSQIWRPFLDCMPQLFFRPQYVWLPVHLKGHLIPLCYETLVVNWQNWLFTLFHQSRSVLSLNPIHWHIFINWWVNFMFYFQFQCLIHNNSSVVQLMNSYLTGSQPMPDPVMTQVVVFFLEILLMINWWFSARLQYLLC